ncbi:hypothetical protein DYB35_008354 [Aphanomyces astaci]|uniref:HAT C-terminal dimerisation domain-containing protein n=1 Tax=Aphanomyces astaci TaxID=112090 RepID=A0A3R6ZE56_APHAT|nr:hypothetical protein DYB35_008354 [Aphanomyces astaci]
MVGCASHRLNLAVRQFLDKQEATLDTIHAVMLRCRTVKNRAALRELTPLAPKLRNDTRWSSTFAMEQRFFAIKDELACIADLRSIFPSPGQIDKMQDLLAALEVIQGFTITLQRHDLAMNEARALLDTLGERFSGMTSYLSPHASIVSNATFEDAVVKVLDDDVGSMLECERAALATFEVVRSNPSPSHTSSDPSCLAMEVLQAKRAKLNERVVMDYEDLRCVLPTSNIIERLFSKAKLVNTLNKGP